MMKRVLLIALLVIQTGFMKAADITSISAAFQKGDVTSLQSSLANQVDLTIVDSNRKCGTQEAVRLLQDFFSANKPESYQMVHHADKGETGFFVAKMKAGQQQYRLNVAYSTENNQLIILSIRIE